MLQHRPEQQSTLQETTLPIAQTEQTVAPAILNDEEVEALIAQLKKRAASASRRFLLGAFWQMPLVTAIGVLIGYWIKILVTTPSPLVFLALGVSLSIFYLYFALPRRHHNAQRAEDLRKMQASGDLRFIEPLTKAWVAPSSVSLTYEIVPAVTQLLGHVDASNAHLLSKKTRKRLLETFRRVNVHSNETVFRTYSTNYVIALMQTLTRIGEIEAIPQIRSLTKLRGKEPSLEEVRTVARECLEILERQATGTLLRPVGESFSADELLRPTAGNIETAPETLLRPIEKE